MVRSPVLKLITRVISLLKLITKVTIVCICFVKKRICFQKCDDFLENSRALVTTSWKTFVHWSMASLRNRLFKTIPELDMYRTWSETFTLANHHWLS
jgi:hypothetical protein